MGEPSPVVSVVIPTYRRPAELHACLAGISDQQQSPSEVIVVRRDDDPETAAALPLICGNARDVVVSDKGVVAAMQAGAGSARGDVIAFIDDDAVPRRDWIERMSALFTDPGVAAVGGRDAVHTSTGVIAASEHRVGELDFWGRSVGNHHIGVGGRRYVDTLKGCNMAFRREFLAIPFGLRGEGAQIAVDMAAALWAKAQGAAVVYDSDLVVDHYPADRHDGQGRILTRPGALYDSAYNSALVTCTLRPQLRWRYLAYHVGIGTRSVPGLIRWGVGLVRGEHLTGRLLVSQRGLLAGVLDSRREVLTFWRAPSV